MEKPTKREVLLIDNPETIIRNQAIDECDAYYSTLLAEKDREINRLREALGLELLITHIKV